jgi:hypothetical protein
VSLDEGTGQRDSISSTTGIALRKVEQELVTAIEACEAEVRRGFEHLSRLKNALRSLRRPEPLPQLKNTSQVGHASRGHELRKPPPRRHRERDGSAAAVIRSFVRRELIESGHPLTRAEILDRMTRAGIEIDAKVPIKRIAKVMWSSKEFVNVGDGYWLAEEPIPASDHGSAD